MIASAIEQMRSIVSNGGWHVKEEISLGGLKKSTRKWYEDNILRILKANRSLSLKELTFELRKLNQRRYPIQPQRIIAFLKFLTKKGIVRYSRSEVYNKPSRWEYIERKQRN